MICHKCKKVLLNRETSNKVDFKGESVVVCDECEELIFSGVDLNG
jgi:RNase P subunit RPR2